MAENGELDELIEQLIERMEQEDYISKQREFDSSQPSSGQGQVGNASHRFASR